jgi:predicted AlkP superfamily pyrophosphatase or phosphodiesterase
LPSRLILVAGAAVVVALVAVFFLSPSQGLPPDAPTEDDMASDLGAQIMGHLYVGHVPGRAGEILMVPKPHHFLVNRFELESLGSAEPELRSSHPNPWDYTARVPYVFYGPGYVPGGREVSREVDISSLAPTYARLLGMEDFEADGRPLAEIEPGPRAPRLIFTIVLDGGGWNVLQRHPGTWPSIARLMRQGTSYVNATIGSAPSVTGALHATFGTGFYPVRHKLPGNHMRTPDGATIDTWQENADPSFLEKPTVSELWDEQTGNRSVVGTLSYEGWHLGMIGHGAQREGADHDIAVLWDQEENGWWINEDFYTLPDYLQETDLDRLEAYEVALDARDGIEDSRWLGHTIEELRDPELLLRPGTPAFVRFNGDAVIDIIRREGLGKDDVSDLFWLELKMPDFAGHAWNMLSAEESDVLLEVDRQIARIRLALDEHVGRSRYVLALSADHGQEPLPEHFGGWRISTEELKRDVEERFGVGLIEQITTVDFFVDRDLVSRRGVDLSDVARFLGTYTVGDNIPQGDEGASRVPEQRLDDTLFAGAFSTEYLQSLTPEGIASFGRGAYEESDLLTGSTRSRWE